MPKGIKGSGAMSLKGYHYVTDEDRLAEMMAALSERLKEIRRLEQERRALKLYVERHKLTAADLRAVAKQMKPQRADKPVKSKKPLQPPGKLAAKKIADRERWRLAGIKKRAKMKAAKLAAAKTRANGAGAHP